MDKKLIFMHLPKCGGTTFHSILERMYSPKEIFDIKVIDNTRLNTEDFIALPSSEKEKLKLVKGHQEFGLHKYFSSESDYITFLRDPIERVVSYYYYVKRRPNHRLYKLNLFTDDMSLYDFVTKVKEGDINNGQIRFISGIADKEEIMLEKALENIENHFSFVGTLEKFDESLMILQEMYYWSTPYYKIQNRTSNRQTISDIDDKTIAAIKELNSGDLFLYNKISKQLEDRWRNEPHLNEKLLKFNAISKSQTTEKNSQSNVKKLVPKKVRKTIKRILGLRKDGN